MNEPTQERERGAALLEFALVLPVVLALLLGIVTSGLALNSNNSLNNGARESARFGATLPTGSLTSWLNEVADVAIESATGDLDDGTDGRYICVAYVHPDGTDADDSTARIEVDEAGARKILAGQSCFVDGRPNDERRVQVMLQRDSDLQFFFFERTVTLEGRSTARFEREL